MSQNINEHPSYSVEKNGIRTVFTFHESSTIPDLPISTPFTFPFIGQDVVLCLDKNDWWNPLGGHMEAGETMEQTLKREALEEAGVHINDIKIIGYVHAISTGDVAHSKYQAENILPITVSFAHEVDEKWLPLETKERGFFSPKRALSLMKQRDDNAQMEKILEHALSRFKAEEYETTFSYHPDKIFDDVPVTQVFLFCRDSEGNFCAVRDHDEDFYSLPGGRCELGEQPEECLRRELGEEAQMTCKNIRFLGSILVSLVKEGKCVSSFQHLRYFADADRIEEFVPSKGGFETVERTFMNVSDLDKKIKLLQNPNGFLLVEQVKKICE